GWNAGGPWITPEHAAKKLVSSQTIVKGPGNISVTLPKPQAVHGFYRDIAVLVSPTEESTFTGKWSASSQFQDYGPALAEDGDDTSRWISNGNKPGMGPTPEKPEFLQFKLDAPQVVGGVYVKTYPECGPKEVEVQCSDDGATFRPLKRETFKPLEAKAILFPETKAILFRVVFLSAHPYRGEASWNVQVSHIELLSPKQKTPASAAWSSRAAIDVTSLLTADGKLAWAAPAGTWKILRIGTTLHGNNIKCVGSGPTGLEIDTMSADAMDAHFAETGAKLLADAGPLAGKTLQYFHIDSWELGQPTWTPKMREEFQKRRGYDPLIWLPAALGQTVDSTEATARFMQDYRRTAADLVAENYYGRLEELSVKGGLRGTHPESGGPFFSHWIDALQCLGRTAIPMGEFWRRNYEPNGDVTHSDNPSLKQAASAAHIYGKPLCQAEAFTSMAACDWTAEPWIFKDIGDKAFCEGLTRNVLCFWVHQPKLDAKPGFQWVHVGTHFDCNVTWWPLADGWLTYLARCQLMLRQGLFVADFAYLQNEAVPSFIQKRPAQQPLRPAGFDYDVLNAEVLLTRATAKDGRLLLPDGMSYRYLVLPHEANAILSPLSLKKINELAAAGVAVIGPASRLADVPKLRQGALDAITLADGQRPDIEFHTSVSGAKFDWIHRRDGKTEIYFVSNQSLLDIQVPVAFRVKGKVPELWDAVTGKIRALPVYKATDDGRTEVPMVFAPRQSFFVVFRGQGAGFRVQEKGVNFQELKPVMDVTGAWEVTFDPKWFYPVSSQPPQSAVLFEKLEDWTQRPEAA
ncbi:MAG: glycosyl hydrolase, partial [Verrucomicrobiota bacterium]